MQFKVIYAYTSAANSNATYAETSAGYNLLCCSVTDIACQNYVNVCVHAVVMNITTFH